MAPLNRTNLLLDTAPAVSSSSEAEEVVVGGAGASSRGNSKELKRRAQTR